jgi:esterase FrsA
MAIYTIKRYVRPIEEVREHIFERARGRGNPTGNPFEFTDYELVRKALDSLTSLDRDEWAAAFIEAARPFEEQAGYAEAAGDHAAAQENYLRAYGYYRAGRYPAPNSPGKRQAYVKCMENYLAAARYFDPPLERVEMPFQGRLGEGDSVVGYLRKPAGPDPWPVVVSWGGIDGFKEERRAEAHLERGMAVLAIDMPGVGEAPIPGSEDAERMFDAVFDWIEARPELDADRVGIQGGSTGGYWATKLAHTHRGRIRAAINHGGCAHYAYTPEWIEKAQHGEYALELAETLASAFGLSTFEEWVDYAPRLSLLAQGILDRPSAPLLLVNGTHDTIFPIDDMYLLMEHGDPKEARFYPVGHMGRTPETGPMMVNWMAKKLGA